MSLVLTGKYSNIWLFYTNRFLRLYPSYLLVVALSICWFQIVGIYTEKKPPPYWVYVAVADMGFWQYFLLQLSNLFMIGLDIPSLFHWKQGSGFAIFHSIRADTAADGAEWCGRLPWVQQAWSVGAELWFYLLAPFTVLRSVYVQALLLVASLALYFVMSYLGYLPYFFFPANLWFFMCGSLLFKLYEVLPKEAMERTGVSAAALGLSVLIVLIGGWVKDEVMHFALVGCLMMLVPVLFGCFSRSRIDTLVGELSYPIYLLHLLVLGVLSAVTKSNSVWMAMLLSTVGAALIVKFVEVPMDRVRQRRAQTNN